MSRANGSETHHHPLKEKIDAEAKKAPRVPARLSGDDDFEQMLVDQSKKLKANYTGKIVAALEKVEKRYDEIFDDLTRQMKK